MQPSQPHLFPAAVSRNNTQISPSTPPNTPNTTAKTSYPFYEQIHHVGQAAISSTPSSSSGHFPHVARSPAQSFSAVPTPQPTFPPHFPAPGPLQVQTLSQPPSTLGRGSGTLFPVAKDRK